MKYMKKSFQNIKLYITFANKESSVCCDVSCNTKDCEIFPDLLQALDLVKFSNVLSIVDGILRILANPGDEPLRSSALETLDFCTVWLLKDLLDDMEISSPDISKVLLLALVLDSCWLIFECLEEVVWF